LVEVVVLVMVLEVALVVEEDWVMVLEVALVEVQEEVVALVVEVE
jgi:hypothetical protein